MYEADFGWGRPMRVTTSSCPVRNSVVLMDTRDRKGIEALGNMEEKDMARFERDAELLQHASFNPTEDEKFLDTFRVRKNFYSLLFNV